jgi:alkylation response protein AidB-like acyl-CoA dehydrogenase
MYNSFFTEEHNMFRDGLQSFLKKEVIPYVDKWEEEGKIERTIWKKFGEMGYFGINYPEAYGGLDLDIFYTVIFLEELQKVNSGGFAAAMWAHAYLAMTHVNAEGTEEIKQSYLKDSINGDKIGCLCISEPFGGSDVGAMRTTAVLDGDHYLINGSKTFITNGVYSDYLIVIAKMDIEDDPKSMGVFLIDRDTAGVSASKLDKLGWRASDTGEIAFDNVRIPKAHLMGESGKGFYYVMQHFALERLIMGINAHARAEYAIEYTKKYMSERIAFGKSIDKFQALRHRIAEMESDVDMIKAYNYTVARELQKGTYVVKEACMSKLNSTKVADEVITNCLQFLGGYGYMEEYPLARMFRDSRLGPIGGGTSEILKEIIAKIVIDKKEYRSKI